MIKWSLALPELKVNLLKWRGNNRVSIMYDNFTDHLHSENNSFRFHPICLHIVSVIFTVNLICWQCSLKKMTSVQLKKRRIEKFIR